MKKMRYISVFYCLAVAATANSGELRLPRLGVVCRSPAQAVEGVEKSKSWEQSLLTGNGEIVTNAAFVAAIKKTLDRRMAFHEQNRHMAFGITQLAYAAAKIGDAAIMARAVSLLQNSYFTEALATLHDPGWLFNIDISGGFPGIIADALVTVGPNGSLQILNAKPPSWTHGRISGLLLPGALKVNELSWCGDEYRLELLDTKTGAITVTTGKR